MKNNSPRKQASKMYIVDTYLQDQIKELHFPTKKKKKFL